MSKKSNHKGNPKNLIVRQGQEAVELGRKGGIASGAARRARCSFADALRQALTVPIPITSDRHKDWVGMIERFGMCDLTAQNLIVCRMIQCAISGDVRAAAFIRDTLMMTGGGIEDAGDGSRIEPATADGKERLMQYHYLEIAEVRERVKPSIEIADLQDRVSITGRHGETERLKVSMEARNRQRKGLVTLAPDANAVTADLKRIEERAEDEGGAGDE